MAEEEQNKIEEVNQAIYARGTDAIFAKKRHALREKAAPAGAPSAWSEEPEKPRRNIPYSKIFLGALIFFFLAVLFALFKFFGGGNTVSGGNIDILLTGPVSISGGEALPLTVEVKNNNPVALQVVDLEMSFPAGTKDPTDLSKDLTRYSEILGDIAAGGNATRLVKSVLYGPENTQEIIKVTVEYRESGSNAVFTKEKDYTVLISSSPVNIDVAGPDEVNANQSADFAVTVSSNSLSTVKNLVLKVGYPFGFNLTSTNIKSISTDQSVFALGDLAPGASITIRLTGVFQGQNGEERVLSFQVGNPSSDDQSVATPFATFSKSIALNRPSVGVSTLINQDGDASVAVSPGEKTEADLSWQNNLAQNIYNMTITVGLSGALLDKTSVSASQGFYNSSANSVVFDKTNDADLDTVAPGAEGGVSLSFASLIPSPGTSDQFNNSQIGLSISVSGTPAGQSAPQVLFTDTRSVKLSSELDLLSRGYRTFGPFENSGPFPPKVDQPTTYTITWTITDSFNDMNGVSVAATLPSNIQWTGLTSPSTENISYNSANGQITWNVGSVRGDTGSDYPARTVSFQVSVTPSVSQVGQAVTLLNEATASGVDAFSGAQVSETKPAVTTNITSDPQYVEGVGNVVQ